MGVDLPRLVTSLPGPRAQAIIDRDHAVLSPSYTRCYPFVMAQGRGAIVEDVDGNRFLDANAGIAVAATGHSHPKVVEAIQDQAGKFLHMSGTDFYYRNMVELAERLVKLTGGERRVYFGNSGTEAVEAALKMARYYTGRQQFISFFGGFHGRTMGALSLTGSKTVQKKGFAPFVPGVHHTPYPNAYRGEMDSIKSLENILRHTVPPEEVAAIIVECVQGEGGYLIPPRSFFEELRALTRQHGMLLIVDEVQSGMGRTGRMFAYEHFGIDPDIITVAKGIASGMPLSAAIARSEIMSWQPGAHASTFGGNPVCIAAALATIDLVERELMSNAVIVGERMLRRMQSWPDRFPNVGDVRGLGLMIGFELVRDQESKERAVELRDRIVQLAFERGLLILGCGRNSIRLCPPLVISEAQADWVLDTLEGCLESLTSAAGSTSTLEQSALIA